MDKNKEITEVIFRKYEDGSLIALFPYVIWNEREGDIASYIHIGQHGAADYYRVISETKLASSEEYKQLYDELSNDVGYNLLIIKKCNRGKYLKELRLCQMKRAKKYINGNRS